MFKQNGIIFEIKVAVVGIVVILGFLFLISRTNNFLDRQLEAPTLYENLG